MWRDLAQAYANHGQPVDAQYCVEQAEMFDPWSAATLHTQGVVHESAGNVAAAVDAYNTALALDAAYAPVLLSLGG